MELRRQRLPLLQASPTRTTSTADPTSTFSAFFSPKVARAPPQRLRSYLSSLPPGRPSEADVGDLCRAFRLPGERRGIERPARLSFAMARRGGRREEAAQRDEVVVSFASSHWLPPSPCCLDGQAVNSNLRALLDNLNNPFLHPFMRALQSRPGFGRRTSARRPLPPSRNPHAHSLLRESKRVSEAPNRKAKGRTRQHEHRRDSSVRAKEDVGVEPVANHQRSALV